ncbi:MAG: hypothetical protein ABF651_11700 [Sporolactobacillus sp.]
MKKHAQLFTATLTFLLILSGAVFGIQGVHAASHVRTHVYYAAKPFKYSTAGLRDIKYPQISGLANSRAQARINADLKKYARKAYLYRKSFLKKNPSQGAQKSAVGLSYRVRYFSHGKIFVK